MKYGVFWIEILIGLCILGAGSGYTQVGIFDKQAEWVLGDHVNGQATFDNGTYVVLGNGQFGVRIEAGFGVEGDEGFYLYTERQGSWSLQANLYPVLYQSALMIREVGDDPASNFYSVEFGGLVGEEVNALFRTRHGASGNQTIPLSDQDGNPIQSTNEGLWFRVTRVEPVDIFFSEFSEDGVNWFIADSRIIKWPSDTAAFGIAVGSGADDEELGEVEVTNVEFVSTPPVGQRAFSQQYYRSNDTLDVSIRVYVSGEDRSTATIEENVPSGWTISNISNNGTVTGNTIRWTLTNLPVGETVISYRATAPASPEIFASWSGNLAESVEILGTDILPLLEITGGDRVDDGLLVLYYFNEGQGTVVHDVSGVGEPMDLIINDLNQVEWGDGYLETTGTTHQVATDDPATKIIEGCVATDELTVEGWVKTSDITQNGPARMITCSIDASNRNFTLGQGHFGEPGNQLEMRIRTVLDNETSSWTGAGTFTEALTHIVFTRNADWEFKGYINNVEIASFNGEAVLGDGTYFVNGEFANWDETYRFGVGNEMAAPRAWQGQLHLVAVYNRALTAEEVSQNYNAGHFVGDEPASTKDWFIY